jgi:hypothetical protein
MRPPPCRRRAPFQYALDIIDRIATEKRRVFNPRRFAGLSKVERRLLCNAVTKEQRFYPSDSFPTVHARLEVVKRRLAASGRPTKACVR